MNNHGKLVVVGLGEILWDLLPDGKQMGGAPANFAYHAHCLGAKAAVVSCVGDDALGREIIARLKALGVESHVAIEGEYPTGTVSVELNHTGVPQYVIHAPVAWDFIPFNMDMLALAACTDAVCFGTLCQRSEVSRQTIARFLSATSDRCLRIFDVNLRQAYGPTRIEDMLDLANVLKLNDDELPELAQRLGLTGSPRDILAALTQRYGLHLVALTRGTNGSLLFTAGQISECGAYPVQVVDTVGAGDAFTAALAVGILTGQELGETNRRANQLASYVCSCKGATPVLPEELLAEIYAVPRTSIPRGTVHTSVRLGAWMAQRRVKRS
jgi:fructokinase